MDSGKFDTWLYIVPFYHFFENKLELFEPQVFTKDHTSSIWWNTNWLKKTDNYKHELSKLPEEQLVFF